MNANSINRVINHRQ